MSKKIVLFVLGGLLIAVGLIYGFTGMLVPSIQERSTLVERWRGEQVKTGEKAKVAMAEADKLGDMPAQRGEGPSPFERKLAEVERLTQDMKQRNEMIDYELGRKKEMSIITAAFCAAGILAMLIGWRLRAQTV